MSWDDAAAGGSPGNEGGATGFGLIVKNQSGDDIGIWELVAPQNFGSNQGTFYIGSEAVDYKDAGYLTFRGLLIPAGATIVSAKIAFKASNNKSASVTVKIFGNDVANPPAVASAAQAEALVLTTAGVEWPVEAWVAGDMYTTPDFSEVIQEIIDRQDWVPGNPIRIIIRDYSSGGNNRTAYGGGANAGDGPVLSVSFTTSA